MVSAVLVHLPHIGERQSVDGLQVLILQHLLTLLNSWVILRPVKFWTFQLDGFGADWVSFLARRRRLRLLQASCGFLGARTLRSHLFSRFLVFFSSSRGSFLSRFFRVSILVNTSGVRVNLFLVEMKRRLLKDLVLKKPDLSRLCSSHYNNLRLHFCYSYF